MQQQQ
jgi:hypothetical protein